MSAIKAIWKNGQVVLDGPSDWPEGRRLLIVEELPAAMEFLTEAE